MANLYDVRLETIHGENTDLGKYRGNVLLLVNVASECGFTPQYTGLEALYQRFKDRGFTLLGFPANDFAGQEPGSNEEIAQFCSTEYPVTFPLFSKITVTGPQKHPLYAELVANAPQRIATTDDLQTHLSEYAAEHGFPPPNQAPELLWNFEKFVIDRQGNIIARFNPDIEPNDPKLIEAIEPALG